MYTAINAFTTPNQSKREREKKNNNEKQQKMMKKMNVKKRNRDAKTIPESM